MIVGLRYANPTYGALQRYVNEFAGRHNIREQDTIDQMAFIARNLVGKRLRYQDLVS